MRQSGGNSSSLTEASVPDPALVQTSLFQFKSFNLVDTDTQIFTCARCGGHITENGGTFLKQAGASVIFRWYPTFFCMSVCQSTVLRTTSRQPRKFLHALQFNVCDGGKGSARTAYFSSMLRPRKVHILRWIGEHTILGPNATGVENVAFYS